MPLYCAIALDSTNCYSRRPAAANAAGRSPLGVLQLGAASQAFSVLNHFFEDEIGDKKLTVQARQQVDPADEAQMDDGPGVRNDDHDRLSSWASSASS